MSAPSSSHNEVVEDDGVLVMNFNDDEEHFPTPMLIKPDEDFINNGANPNHPAHSIKLEGNSEWSEETEENILKEFGVTVPDEEYILGTEATAEILATARATTGIENNDPTEVQTQLDLDTITLDSDGDDDGISSNNNSNIPLIENVDKSKKTYDNLNGSKLSHDFSSIIITNVESVVDGSADISSHQVEERAAGELENSKSLKLNSVETKELDLPNNYISGTKQRFKCKVCPFSSKTRFSLTRHTSRHIKKDDMQVNEESVSENKIASQSDVCSLGTGINNNENFYNKNNSLCQFNDSINSSFKCNGESSSKVSQQNICPVDTSTKSSEDSASENNVISQSNICFVPASLKVPNTCIFTCKFCSFSSKIRFALQRHVVLNHADITKKSEPSTEEKIEALSQCLFECTDCIFIAKSEVGLANHMRLRHRKINCSSCHKVLKEQHMQQHKLTCYNVKKGYIKTGRPVGRPRSTAPVIVKARKRKVGRPSSTAIAISKEIKTSNGVNKNNTENNLEKNAIENSHKTAGPSAQSNTSSTATIRQCAYCSYTGKNKISRHTALHTRYNKPIYRCKQCPYKSTTEALKRHIISSHKALKNVPIKKRGKIGGLVRTKSGKNAQEGQDTTLKNGLCNNTPTRPKLKVKTNGPLSQSDSLGVRKVPKEISKTSLVNAIEKPDSEAIIKSILDEASKKLNRNPSHSNLKASRFQCSYCPHVSQGTSNFTAHLRMHIKSKKPLYSCKECNYVSINSHLTRHIRMVHSKLSDRNTTCNNIRLLKQVKLSQGNIKRKRESEHLVDSSTLTGSERGSTWTGNISEVKLKDLKEDSPQLSGKRRHTVSGVESTSILYVCEICAYETNNKEALIFHKRTHAGTTLPTDERTCLDLKYETHTDQLTGKILTKPEKTIPKNITEAKEQNRKCVLLKDGSRQCSECERIFVNNAGFANHRCEDLSVFFKLVRREGTKFTCKECLFSSDSWLRVKQHLLVHKSFEEAAIYKCLICDYRSKYKFALGKHMRNVHDVHENSRYSCDICNYKTNFHRSIRNHKMSCHNELLICDICGYRTILATVMLNHKKTLHPEKDEVKADIGSNENIKYKCDNCDFQTNYKHNLQNHKILHININELKVYKNQTFNVKINKESSRTSSYEERTDGDVTKPEAAKSSPPSNTSEVLFSCNLCSYSSHNKANFGAHMNHCKARHVKNSYKCHVCDYRTSSSSNLRIHTGTHATLYHCDQCTYSTRLRITLYGHRYRKHSIGKMTTTKRDKKNRVESKNSTKSTKTKSSIQFSCKYCEYTTKFRFNLKKHTEKRHSNNKKVKTRLNCGSCSFTTKYQHSLANHVRWKHGENDEVDKSKTISLHLVDVSATPMLKCSCCFYTTKHKFNLDRHFNTCHVQK